jgi:hypothetical protein
MASTKMTITFATMIGTANENTQWMSGIRRQWRLDSFSNVRLDDMVSTATKRLVERETAAAPNGYH